MQDLETLEKRIMLSLSRIRAATQAAGLETETATENRMLRQQLAEIAQKRDEDVSQLDALIAEIRPLIDQTQAPE